MAGWPCFPSRSSTLTLSSCGAQHTAIHGARGGLHAALRDAAVRDRGCDFVKSDEEDIVPTWASMAISSIHQVNKG